MARGIGLDSGRVWSLKRLGASLILAPALMLLALGFAFGTTLSDGSPQPWRARDVLGLVLAPAAYIERFEETRSGYILSDDLPYVAGLQLAYAYTLLTLAAAARRRRA